MMKCVLDKNPVKNVPDDGWFFSSFSALFFLFLCCVWFFDFFLPAVVVGIVVTGTEIRAQACLSAKAAAACEYRAVVGRVDPSDYHQVPLMCPPQPPVTTAQLLVSLSAAPCRLVTAAFQSQTQTIALFILTLHTATLIHERQLRHGSSVPVESHWPGKEWHGGRSRCS